MPDRELIINLSYSTPRFGLWCDRCNTAAGFEFDMLHLADDGPEPFTTIRRCLNCDGYGDGEDAADA